MPVYLLFELPWDYLKYYQSGSMAKKILNLHLDKNIKLLIDMTLNVLDHVSENGQEMFKYLRFAFS